MQSTVWWESSNTCKMVEKESQWMNVNFSVFHTAFDFNTSAPLTTLSHKRFIVSWACRSLGENGNYISDSEYNFTFPYFPNDELNCFYYKTQYISEYFFFLSVVVLYFSLSRH